MKGKRPSSTHRSSESHRRAPGKRLLPSIAVGVLIVGLAVASLTSLPRPEDSVPDQPSSGAGADSLLARAPKAACPSADKRQVTNTRRFRTALSCLRNVERRKHGLGSLRWDADLGRVARRHVRDMIRRHYFKHLSPGGRDHMDRIAASGYKPATGCWSAGENLYFAHGASTPRRATRALLHSAAHRKNILNRRWEDFGAGVVAESPFGEPGGVTVAVLYATRFKGRC